MSNRDARLLTTAAFAFYALLEISGFFDGGTSGIGGLIFAEVIVVACVSAAIRSAIAFTVRASDTGLRVRTVIRMRRYRWTEIAGFEVCMGPVGQMAWTRKIFTLTTTDGKKRWFRDLDTSTKASGLDDFVEVLNAEVARSRQVDAPDPIAGHRPDSPK